MKKTKISNGVYLVSIPEHGLEILCGCPMDSIKLLKQKGVVRSYEEDGRIYETGPNAILLSDVSMQNRTFCNLAEFPVLHMLFKQKSQGRKPLLIGNPKQIAAQTEYIYRGTYGLTTKEELIDAGASEAEAESMLRMKRCFAGGKLPFRGEMLDTCVLDSGSVELRPGLSLARIGINQFEFSLGDDLVSIDLNLGENQDYQPPYRLEFHHISREYFSIIHLGEGNGWDPFRPCMSSILCFQGRYYLIDAGPNIQHSLTSMGIGINEIDGIFHTHAHDDHFAGLTALLESDHSIKYYATPLVRNSVFKKMTGLLSVDESLFQRTFDFVDLENNIWNNVDGLEVKPVFSAHPVETTVLFFRVFWNGGYKSYAHLADIPSLKVLGNMVEEDPKKPGVSKAFYQEVTQTLKIPVDIKKIDVGGGMIHGDAGDFTHDLSGKIILSHTSEELTNEQKEIGSNASFGMQDVILPSRINYCQVLMEKALREYFPRIPESEIQVFMNCPLKPVNLGAILMRKGQVPGNVYLILSGEAEYIDTDLGIHNRVSSGSLVGEIECLFQLKARGTTRAVSYLKVLSISSELYQAVIERNEIKNHRMLYHDKRIFLKNSSLFGDSVSSTVQARIAQKIELLTLERGEAIQNIERGLYLLQSGWMSLYYNGKRIETLGRGSFWGEHSFLGEEDSVSALAGDSVSLYFIPAEHLLSVPIIYWKCIEIYEKRKKSYTSDFSFTWREEYLLGIDELDEGHQRLVQCINRLFMEEDYKSAEVRRTASDIKALVLDHLISENKYLDELPEDKQSIHKKNHLELKDTAEHLIDTNGTLDTRILDRFKVLLFREILEDDRLLTGFLQRKRRKAGNSVKNPS